MFEAVLEQIKKYPRIILHRHSKPDGDALGSQIGMKHILLANFPEKEVFMVGDGAGRYSFMDDSVMDEIPDSAYEGALAIILDTSSPGLISDDRYSLAAKTVRLDHHLFIEQIANEEVIGTDFESCCGLITAFVMESGLTLPPLAAKSLFTGMVTDSGRFRYDCATAQTFRLAAFLMEHGVNLNEIYGALYADDFEFIRLRAQMVLKIQFTPHKVAYIYTTKKEVADYGVDTFTISRGMVNIMSDIKGVSIWVNFTETDNGVLVELRSSKYNINTIAVKYGGGGHEKASGATLRDYDEAMAMLNDLDALQGGNQ